jgi:hypothetical protein
MKVTLTDHKLNLLPASNRSTGVHMSDLYNGVYKKLEPTRFHDSEPDQTVLAVGLAWENYFEERLRENGIAVYRPPEQFTKEGVAFNPDGIIDGPPRRGVEYKTTRMKDPGPAVDQEKFSKWLTQVKAYGYHLEIPTWTIYALFLNGDYKVRRLPIVQAYDVTFTKAELKACWDTLYGFGRSEKLLP